MEDKVNQAEKLFLWKATAAARRFSERPEARTLGYYKKRPCAAFVKCAAKITEEYLEENKNENSSDD